MCETHLIKEQALTGDLLAWCGASFDRYATRGLGILNGEDQIDSVTCLECLRKALKHYAELHEEATQRGLELDFNT